MRKYMIATAVALSCDMALAQGDNKALFHRAVDRLNCEAVNWSMESVKNSRFKEQCPCEDGPGYEQVKACIGVADVAKTTALSEDIERVKKDFKDAWTKDEAVRYLTSTVFNDSTKHGPLCAFVSRTEKEDKKDKPRREHARFIAITNTVAGMLDDWAVAPPHVQEGSQAYSPPESPPTKADGPGLLAYFIVWLASVFTSAVIMFLLLRRWDGFVSDEVRNYVKRKIGESQQGTLEAPPTQPRRNSGKNHDQLAGRVKELGQEVQRLHEQVAMLLSNTPPNPPAPPLPPEPRPSVEYFLPAPDPNGVFGEASAAYNERKHVYKLTKRGDDRASFVIHQHPQAIGIALARHDVYIRPVCDASNAYDPNARGITTEAPGEAKLEGGKWKMTSKAKVRYES